MKTFLLYCIGCILVAMYSQGMLFTFAQSSQNSLSNSSQSSSSQFESCSNTYRNIDQEITLLSQKNEQYMSTLSNLQIQFEDLQSILRQENAQSDTFDSTVSTFVSEKTQFNITLSNHIENLQILSQINCESEEFLTLLSREQERRKELLSIGNTIESTIANSIRNELLSIRDTYKLN